MLKPREAGVQSAGGWLPLDATPRPPDVAVERVAASGAPAASGTTAALHLADDVTVVQSQLAHAHSRAHTHACGVDRREARRGVRPRRSRGVAGVAPPPQPSPAPQHTGLVAFPY